MKDNQIKERLDEIFSNVENGHDTDEVCFKLNKLIVDIDESRDNVKELEYDKPTNGHQFPEIHDSVKITKNTKGYNYEFRVIAKENVDLLAQVDYIQKQLEERVKLWSVK